MKRQPRAAAVLVIDPHTAFFALVAVFDDVAVVEAELRRQLHAPGPVQAGLGGQVAGDLEVLTKEVDNERAAAILAGWA